MQSASTTDEIISVNLQTFLGNIPLVLMPVMENVQLLSASVRLDGTDP